MSIFDEVLPINPDGPFELHDEVHDFLYFHRVKKAFDRGLLFDFHLSSTKASKEDMERIFLQFLEAEISEYSCPYPTIKTTLATESDRWRASSAMQKAIRRGDTEAALKAARALLTGGFEDNLYRRMAVIVMEDVGLADPYLAALVCLTTNRKAWRNKLGAEKCLFYFITELCEAKKSRDLVDVVVYTFLSHTLEEEFAEVRDLTEGELISLMCDLSKPHKYRHLAHWCMFGDAWNQPFKEKVHKIKSEVRITAYDKLGLPPLISYVADKAFRSNREALSIPVPFMYQLMCASKAIWVDKDPEGSDDETKIGNVYAATYDKHVWDGKSSYRYVLKMQKNWLEFMNSNIDKPVPMDVVGRAVFYVEGGVLRDRVFFDRALDVYNAVLDAKIKEDGWPTPELGRQFFSIVRDQIDKLHYARRKVLGVPQPE